MATHPRLSQVLARWWHYHPSRPATRTELAAAEKRITSALKRMGTTLSKITDLIAEVDAATNEVADRIDRQTARITDLTTQLANAAPGSEEAAALRAQVDEAVAGFTSTAERLRTIGADPDAPVPPSEPTDFKPEPPADAPVEPPPAQ